MISTHDQFLIALGSNLGERGTYIAKAIEAIDKTCGPVLRQAALLDNPPMGQADQRFLNTAIIISSPLAPPALLERLLKIERDLDRRRDVRWGNRTIDLDIILWRRSNGKAKGWQDQSLSIPHPGLADRDFVLIPANEIAPDWLDASGTSIRELLKNWQSRN